MTSEKRRADQGFTLIELLVVLAIIGLLATIVTPQVLKHLDNAKLSTAKIQVENLSGAVDLFKLDTGRYPANDEGLAALVKAPPSLANWNGPYIKRGASLEDPWGRAYGYKNPGDHAEVDIFSQGPAGGKVIGNW
jgi:general secretion pathway protein G